MLRAIAALMVVALHACIQAGPFGGRPFPLGNAGVDIFFPISGFVMVVSTEGRAASFGAAGRFALARILRIVPIYWLVSAVKVTLMAVRPGSLAPLGIKAIAGALLFIPLHLSSGELAYPPVKPGWTLNLEMSYYLLIVAVMPFSRRIAVWTPLAIIGVVTASRLAAPHFPPLTGELGWGSPLALEFAAGMILGQLTLSRAWRGRWPLLALAAGLAIYAFAPTSAGSNEWTRALGWGVPGLLFLWAAVGAEPFLRAGGWTRIPKLLGDASYSIYLTHALTQPIITAALGRQIVSFAGWPAFVAVQIIAPTLMAVAFHKLVERPLTRGLKSRLTLPATRRPVAAQA
ncbi:MAG TPA: acyltransferase [Caulobacteraceae bacterium]|nr:acyltransferase [Caulobacteraceae bacterium]